MVTDPERRAQGRGMIHHGMRIAGDRFAIAILPRRKRAARRRTVELRDRFIAGRGLLRALLGRYLRLDSASLRFRYGPHGKPALEGDAIRFNLSHSHGLSLFAFTRAAEIGIDLERIR